MHIEFGTLYNDSEMTVDNVDVLTALADEVVDDSQKWFGDVGETDHHSLEMTALCLVGEVGEVCNIVKKMNRGDHVDEAFLEALDEEVVDVFIYLLKFAGLRNLDLLQGYLAKREKNAQRFSAR